MCCYCVFNILYISGKTSCRFPRHCHSVTPREATLITKTQTYPWEPLGADRSTWESPKPASNLWSLQETLGVDGSKRKSLVDTIFGIRRKIKTHYIFSILCFPDIPTANTPSFGGSTIPLPTLPHPQPTWKDLTTLPTPHGSNH